MEKSERAIVHALEMSEKLEHIPVLLQASHHKNILVLMEKLDVIVL